MFDGTHGAAKDAEKLLTHLLKQGRSFGIHVLLATQSLLAGKVNAQLIKGLVKVKLALQCNDKRDYQELFGNAFSAPVELAKTGYAVLQESSGTENEKVTVFRCPYMTDEARRRFLELYRELSTERGYGTAAI